MADLGAALCSGHWTIHAGFSHRITPIAVSPIGIANFISERGSSGFDIRSNLDLDAAGGFDRHGTDPSGKEQKLAVAKWNGASDR